MSKRLVVGVIGCGYWGPNLARNLFEHPGVELRYACDLSPTRLSAIAQKYPSVTLVTESSRIFDDPAVDAVAIATPANTHFALAQQALAANKHVLIEKPMCLRSQECLALISLAQERQLTLMVDHPFVYHGAIRRIKQEIDSSALGDVLYFDSVRINLGLFQPDVNVVWDLAPHDLSIIDFLFPQTVKTVHAFGASHTPSGLSDMAYVTMTFENELVAHLHLSWLSPVKVRQIMIGGTRKMVAYDDNQSTEKLKIYDKGVVAESEVSDESRYRNLVQYRIGDTHSPVLDQTESLKREIAHFVECIQTGATPDTDGHSGYRIVSILEAIDRAMLSGQTQDFTVSRLFERV